jgi:Pvc16 N-terminal domain
MIGNVLEIIKEEVETFLKLKIQDNQEQYVKLVPVVDMEGKAAVTENAMCMSLVRIEEDRVNMSNGTQQARVNNQVHAYNPPLKLNMYILFSAAYIDGQEKNYKEALKRLSYVLAYFQSKKVFTTQNTPRLDHGYGRITIELCQQGMEEQNNLWSMLGSLYRPSVLYRFRALMIQEQQVTAIHEPTGEPKIELNGK